MYILRYTQNSFHKPSTSTPVYKSVWQNFSLYRQNFSFIILGNLYICTLLYLLKLQISYEDNHQKRMEKFLYGGSYDSNLLMYPSTQKVDRQTEKQDDYYVAAYIWPSCHNDPMGQDTLWGEGIGEWEVIKKGNPRFEGHYQPKVTFVGI